MSNSLYTVQLYNNTNTNTTAPALIRIIICSENQIKPLETITSDATMKTPTTDPRRFHCRNVHARCNTIVSSICDTNSRQLEFSSNNCHMTTNFINTNHGLRPTNMWYQRISHFDIKHIFVLTLSLLEGDVRTPKFGLFCESSFVENFARSISKTVQLVAIVEYPLTENCTI